ncbi:glycosyltransferase family A protein [Phenylobacterium sp.]|uniref:glycosyltransferase family A protein n=1 Tax=Phenylobacterium sp. TaxID=1871053 RepID=UPI0027301D7B|nr:glycosyltransferase family A protein [Phenylobacterium sp.]MDP1598986.1 glycosyltransferase family A protein [Phenylobacterium sp.]MDP3590414.1 glycosyltransferase family A protein [Phenylobacterium sp.]
MTQSTRVSRTSPPDLDIVIPARGEVETLRKCLSSVIEDAQGCNIQVIVVANGPERARSLEIVAELTALATARGVQLLALAEERPGKANALNRGDAYRRGGPVLYLDADIRFLPDSLPSLCEYLNAHDTPRLVAPPRKIARSPSFVTRHFARVWATLPAVAQEVVAVGCYAVNSQGRMRWAEFPNLLNDDAFVRSRFAPTERQLLSRGGALQELPQGPALLSTLRRWREGNLQLRDIAAPDALPEGDRYGSAPDAGMKRNMLHVLRHPSLWVSMPIFLWATFASRRAGRTLSPQTDWLPARSLD